MCKIAGIKFNKDTKPKTRKEIVKDLFVQFSRTEQDGYGIASPHSIIKALQINKLLDNDNFDKIATSDLVLMHGRTATHGKIDTANAQPLINGRFALAHNGIIYPYYYGENRFSDTYRFLQSIETVGNFKQKTAQTSFGAMILFDRLDERFYVTKSYGGSLYYVRDNLDNCYFITSDDYLNFLEIYKIYKVRSRAIRPRELIRFGSKKHFYQLRRPSKERNTYGFSFNNNYSNYYRKQAKK